MYTLFNVVKFKTQFNDSKHPTYFIESLNSENLNLFNVRFSFNQLISEMSLKYNIKFRDFVTIGNISSFYFHSSKGDKERTITVIDCYN